MRPVPLDGDCIKTYGRVNEPDRLFTKRNPSIVDCCKHSTHHRRRSRGSEDKAEIAVNSNDVVGTGMDNQDHQQIGKISQIEDHKPVSREIRESTRRSGRVPDVGGVGRREFGQIAGHGALLVLGHGKVVTEASSGKDDTHASTFRVCYLLTGKNLSSTNASDERAPSGERGVEELAIEGLATIGIQAKVGVTGNTKVTRRVENSDTHQSELQDIV